MCFIPSQGSPMRPRWGRRATSAHKWHSRGAGGCSIDVGQSSPAVVVIAVNVQDLLALNAEDTGKDAFGQACAQHNDIVFFGDLIHVLLRFWSGDGDEWWLQRRWDVSVKSTERGEVGLAIFSLKLWSGRGRRARGRGKREALPTFVTLDASIAAGFDGKMGD